MTNVHYLRSQLKMAADHIRRGLDALEAEPAAADDSPPRSCVCNDPMLICPVHPRGPTAAELLAPAEPFPMRPAHVPTREDLRAALAADGAAELPQQAPPSPRLAGLVNRLEDRVLRIDGGLDALAARVEQLAKILLDIAPDACARHDLFGF